VSQMHDHANIIDPDGRYDFYGPIHKGLRKAQSDLLVRLGNEDFGDARASAELLADMREFLALAAAHMEHEHHHIHDALRSHGADCVDRLDEQHDARRAAFAKIEAMLEDIEAGTAERTILGRRLYLAFSAYVARDLEHMLEEETVAAPQLWSLFSDAELISSPASIS